MALAVETLNLSRIFKTPRGDVQAVAGIDLAVGKNVIFGLLGPNGAGKSTLMRMLVTLLRPSGGSASVAGFDVGRQPSEVRRHLGYVAQASGADAAVTGRAELVFQGRAFGMARREARERADSLLERFDLSQPADRPTMSWSGGQRRRLDIALAFMHDPSLLVLDEPTTGLDPQSRARLWDEIRQLQHEGATILLTTHYLEEADALCDRVTIVDHGKVVCEGTPDELKRQIAGDLVVIDLRGGCAARALTLLEEQPFVRSIAEEEGQLRLYVDHAGSALPAILRLLDGAGLSPSSLSLSRPSLDDVFLRQTGRLLRKI